MSDSYAVFEIFNQVEAFIWFGVAIALPFCIKARSRREWLGIIGGSIGFILFGITDLLESPTHGQMPTTLWIFKISCAAFLLACRFTYIGWGNFRVTDRWFVFGLLCLFVSLAIFYWV